jgi:S-adenosylmethionine hydrolase
MIAIKLEEHYFVGADCGLFPLLSEKEPTVIVELRPDASFSQTFPDRSLLATAAVSLASAANIYNLGQQVKGIKKMLNRQLKITREQISGHVVHVDHYGNLITNIPREAFETVRKDRSFIIQFGVEALDQVMDSYQGVENGDCLALFNSNGMLEIAISQGNASELLGMAFDSPVTIGFNG